MTKQLRDYLVAFELYLSDKARSAKSSEFSDWLGKYQGKDEDDARTLGKELERDLRTLEEGGLKAGRIFFSIPLLVSLALIVLLWKTGSNELANAMGWYGIACLAFGGLASFFRFSDLFSRSSIHQYRLWIGLGRNDLIGLLGTAGIMATTAASYFKFTHLAFRLTADNREIITVLKAILTKLP